MTKKRLVGLFCVCMLWTALASAQKPGDDPVLKATELGATRNVHSFGKCLLCGQPSAEEFAEAKSRGVEAVITLREKGEIAWDEKSTVEGLGLKFYDFGFNSTDSLTDDKFSKVLAILAKSKQTPVMLHCASANRVGAVWLAHRVLNDKLTIDEATKEAREVGLRAKVLEERAIEYVKKQQ